MADDLSQSTGDRLRKARIRAGLTQDGLAERMGVSRGTITNYEIGHTHRYGRLFLRTWAEATGTTVEQLLPRRDSNTEPAELVIAIAA